MNPWYHILGIIVARCLSEENQYASVTNCGFWLEMMAFHTIFKYIVDVILQSKIMINHWVIELLTLYWNQFVSSLAHHFTQFTLITSLRPILSWRIWKNKSSRQQVSKKKQNKWCREEIGNDKSLKKVEEVLTFAVMGLFLLSSGMIMISFALEVTIRRMSQFTM